MGEGVVAVVVVVVVHMYSLCHYIHIRGIGRDRGRSSGRHNVQDTAVQDSQISGKI